MSVPTDGHAIRAVLLDIEGTTTPISFVHDVLFTYARRHLLEFLDDPAHAADVARVARQLAAEHASDTGTSDPPPPWRSDSPAAQRVSLVGYVHWLMDRDRKSPGLKTLQGLIWEDGYRAGTLRGLVYDDVPVAMRAWHDAGLDIAIYSSGSALTQRRLFASTIQGDLSALIRAHFDTSVGPKRSADSYRQITRALGHAPEEILFISDVIEELWAAREVGVQVRLIMRPGNAAVVDHQGIDVIRALDEVHVPRTY